MGSSLTFYPCGKQGEETFKETRSRLLRISGYSNCIKPKYSTFVDVIGNFLNNIHLAGADLSRIDFRGANLKGANLSNTDMRRADLSGADLSGANLRNAYLRAVDFSGADLTGADLTGADIERAYFSKANLSGTILCRTKLHGADLTDAFFGGLSFGKKNYPPANFKDIKSDGSTKWFNSRGLHKVEHIPDELNKQNNFKDAIELSQGIEYLINGNINNALTIQS